MQLTRVEFFLQYFVHMLLTLNAALASKFSTYHRRLEMLTIAIEVEIFAGHASENKLLDLFGVHHVQPLSFQPRLSRRRVSMDTAAKQATTTARLVSGATSETPKKP